MLGVDKIAQHANCPEVPKQLLVFWTSGRKVPESPAGVAHYGQAVGAQVLQQSVETVVVPEDLSVKEEDILIIFLQPDKANCYLL